MIMKNVFIYGAGGLGREVYCWLRDVQKNDSYIHFAGFLDDGCDLSDYPLVRDYYVGKGEDWMPGPDDYAVVAVGLIDLKLRIIERIRKKGGRFFNLIHPSAILGMDVLMGDGNIICPHCVLTSNIRIGNFNLFNVGSTIGHDVNIGSYNTLSPHNDITGFVTLGDKNFLGSKVSVIPGKKIGDRNKISAGSVIFRNVKDDRMVMGNPARSFK